MNPVASAGYEFHAQRTDPLKLPFAAEGERIRIEL